jgi:tetratricopeptide (TPR) repeat protein
MVPVSGEDDAAGKAYHEAIDLLQKKQFVQGVKAYYKFLLAHDPLSSVEVRKSELRNARSFFVEEAKKTGGNQKALLLLSIVYRIVEFMDPAGGIVDKLLATRPDSPLLLFLKGEYSMWQDMVDTGTQYFLKLQEHPRGKNLWNVAKLVQKRYGVDLEGEGKKNELIRRGYRHYDLMEWKKAEDMFRQVQREFPDEFEATRGLVEMFTEAGRLPDADQELKVLKTKSISKVIPYLEMRLRFRQNRFAEVVQIAQPLLVENPGNNYLRGLHAEALFQEGKFAEALPFFSELLKFDPGNMGYIQRHVECLENSGNVSDAVSVLKAAISRHPACEDYLRIQLGEIYERCRIFHLAKEQYEMVVVKSEKLREEAKAKFAHVLSLELDRKDLVETPAPESDPSPPNIPPPVGLAPPERPLQQPKPTPTITPPVPTVPLTTKGPSTPGSEAKENPEKKRGLMKRLSNIYE